MAVATQTNGNYSTHKRSVFSSPLFWLSAILYVAGWVLGVVGTAIVNDDNRFANTVDRGYNIFILALDALTFLSWLTLLARHGSTFGYRLALSAMLLIVTLHEVNWARYAPNNFNDNGFRLMASAGIIKSIANFLLLILWGVERHESSITRFYGEHRPIAINSAHGSTAEMTGVRAV